MALYRKYRPATFAEVVGQEHVTVPLGRALDAGRINHAYLFSGPRGCGKTSSARILARSLNCEHGPTSTPCGECASCRALAPGGPGSLDVTELDAASHRGVDDMRELRDRAIYAPAESRYRVFIIDEAHMITKEGFNALLKIVEEPPEHLVFIFATTEPEKVLTTIKSRTHQYPFRLLAPNDMRGLLERICAQEHVRVEDAVYPLVIRAGGGSPRDSLSVLDQLLAGAGPEGITYEHAVGVLGITDAALIDAAVDAVAEQSPAALFQTIDNVLNAGHDPRRFATDLVDRFRDLLVLQSIPRAFEQGLVDAPVGQRETLAAEAAAIGPATLTRCATVVSDGLNELKGATSPRLLLEIMCARMVMPGAAEGIEALSQRVEALESGTVSPAGAANAGSGGGVSHGPGAGATSAHVASPGRTGSAAAGTAASPEQRPAGQGNAGGESTFVYERPSVRRAREAAEAKAAAQRAAAGQAENQQMNGQQAEAEPVAANAEPQPEPETRPEPQEQVAEAQREQDEQLQQPQPQHMPEATPQAAEPMAQESAPAPQQMDREAISRMLQEQAMEAEREMRAKEAAERMAQIAETEGSAVIPQPIGGQASAEPEHEQKYQAAQPAAHESAPARPADHRAAEQAAPAEQTERGEQGEHHQAPVAPVEPVEPVEEVAETRETPTPEAASAVVETEQSPVPPRPELTADQVQSRWEDIRRTVGKQSKVAAVMAAEAVVLGVYGNHVVLGHHTGALAHRLNEPRNNAAIVAGIKEVLGADVTVEGAIGTDAKARQRWEDAHPNHPREAVAESSATATADRHGEDGVAGAAGAHADEVADADTAGRDDFAGANTDGAAGAKTDGAAGAKTDGAAGANTADAADVSDTSEIARPGADGVARPGAAQQADQKQEPTPPAGSSEAGSSPSSKANDAFTQLAALSKEARTAVAAAQAWASVERRGQDAKNSGSQPGSQQATARPAQPPHPAQPSHPAQPAHSGPQQAGMAQASVGGFPGNDSGASPQSAPQGAEMQHAGTQGAGMPGVVTRGEEMPGTATLSEGTQGAGVHGAQPSSGAAGSPSATPGSGSGEQSEPGAQPPQGFDSASRQQSSRRPQSAPSGNFSNGIPLPPEPDYPDDEAPYPGPYSDSYPDEPEYADAAAQKPQYGSQRHQENQRHERYEGNQEPAYRDAGAHNARAQETATTQEPEYTREQEEEEMLEASRGPANYDHRSAKEIAMELLHQELGATPL